eukprot:3982857-Prymnesium_polylepis.2
MRETVTHNRDHPALLPTEHFAGLDGPWVEQGARINSRLPSPGARIRGVGPMYLPPVLLTVYERVDAIAVVRPITLHRVHVDPAASSREPFSLQAYLFRRWRRPSGLRRVLVLSERLTVAGADGSKYARADSSSVAPITLIGDNHLPRCSFMLEAKSGAFLACGVALWKQATLCACLDPQAAHLQRSEGEVTAAREPAYQHDALAPSFSAY